MNAILFIGLQGSGESTFYERISHLPNPPDTASSATSSFLMSKPPSNETRGAPAKGKFRFPPFTAPTRSFNHYAEGFDNLYEVMLIGEHFRVSELPRH
jgi:hypothetical protein